MQGAPILGQRVGPYELLHKISVGGMAETFLAKRCGPGGFEQQVCLKRVLPAFAQDHEFVRLFLDEARLAAQLRHTNIVQVYDFGLEGDAYYMALELIEGMDLRQLLEVLEKQQRTIPPEVVAIIATELTSALEYAHSLEINNKHAGVVHRDISPSNVLLSYTGSVKLADFGIAKAATHAHVTRSGVVKGKVPYMAPEHATGAEIDARSDLFSLGVLLYEALTGFRPFDGPNDMATLTNLVSGKFKRLSEAAPQTPPHFAQIVEKLISARPEDRYQSATELLDALVHAAPPSTTKRSLGTLVREARTIQPTPVDIAKTSTTSGIIARPSSSLPTFDDASHSGKTDQETTAAEHPLAASTPEDDTRTRAATPQQQPRISTFIQPELPTRKTYRTLATFLAIAAAATLLALAITFIRRGPAKPSIVSASLPAQNAEAPSPAPPATAPHPVPSEPLAQATIAPTPATTPEPSVTTPAASAQPPATTHETTNDDMASPSEEEPAPSEGEGGRGGVITVRVVPWGNVWIDGHYYGKGPITKKLSPGDHRVAGGHGRPIAHKTIRVRSGRSQNIEVHVD